MNVNVNVNGTQHIHHKGSGKMDSPKTKIKKKTFGIISTRRTTTVTSTTTTIPPDHELIADSEENLTLNYSDDTLNHIK